jgi:hypothetical protein
MKPHHTKPSLQLSIKRICISLAIITSTALLFFWQFHLFQNTKIVSPNSSCPLGTISYSFEAGPIHHPSPVQECRSYFHPIFYYLKIIFTNLALHRPLTTKLEY